MRGFRDVLMADPCSYCGGLAGYVDHITAQAVGGTHEADNLTASCRRCNSRKRTSSLLGFLLWVRYEPELLRAQAIMEDAAATARACRSVGI